MLEEQLVVPGGVALVVLVLELRASSLPVEVACAVRSAPTVLGHGHCHGWLEQGGGFGDGMDVVEGVVSVGDADVHVGRARRVHLNVEVFLDHFP